MNNDNSSVGIPVNVGSSSTAVNGGHALPVSTSPPTGGPVNIKQKTESNTNLTNFSSSNNMPNSQTASLNNLSQQIQAQLQQPNVTPQQKQRLLLQQRAIQQQRQQQAMQNYENQFYQLLTTLNRKPKRLYNFVEDTDSILKKYEQYRPSFEFHIYENNYKICAPANTRLQKQQKSPEISNNGLVLTKNNETLKEFLEYVARGRIPESIMEVLRDCNIQFYEANLILQVYDHTNTVDIVPKDQQETSQTKSDSTDLSPKKTQEEMNAERNQSDVNTSKEPSHQSQQQQQQQKRATAFKRPRVYRTLLKPNDLTNYYDMMTYADQARFSDHIYQQLESEVLILTKRNINLDVDLNPYEHTDKLDPNDFVEPVWDASKQKLEFVHREESNEDGTKGKVGHIEEHEDLPQHSSNYEQLMLIMSERTTTSTSSTFAASIARQAAATSPNVSGGSSGSALNRTDSGFISRSNSNTRNGNTSENQVSIAAAAVAAAVSSNMGNENNQFSRLKFIEQWRVNKEKRKQQQALNLKNNNGIAAIPFNTKISMTTPLTPVQQQLLQQKQQAQQLQKQMQNGDGSTSGKATQAKGKRGQNSSTDKSKTKRPRKTKKTADSEESSQTKKKKVTKKKGAAGSTSVGTPNSINTYTGSASDSNTPNI
ncbi:hypothetical protein KAFR_0A08690 [Kazachstania africana CBS 2517]|uniref:Spt20-like SEP domain-containing protein n=1 Tax=Kazachstania africana (strain ATCC 22294 / BCRC 22015 / CBS 2517 / CECT 1963 / NBRC 1671 / NRRL Y-8276) TaxID=1071382 RepID=H2APK3_KAZAF|nr:hypothetical protein KAFR_0A08690 [Kazachstania africana CBS 2517]CCF56303.1 hypothetical protein KAFR_0A08690 [Kazachstania africana CBS 2517]